MRSPGISVIKEFKKTAIEPHIYSEQMADFYRSTDAFLYELVIWNRNRLKRRMRKHIVRYLDKYYDRPTRILTIGDGLGFDAVYFSQSGHDVTYFELPGKSQAFAKKVFELNSQNVTVTEDISKIPKEHFDAVICLDVLEHVPEPGEFVKQLTGHIKNEGMFVVHAPFYMVHKSNPTHLKSNCRFSGSMSLYKDNGLKLIDGQPYWNPLLFQRSNSAGRQNFTPKIFFIYVCAVYLLLARFSSLPYWWVNRYRKKRNSWFDK